MVLNEDSSHQLAWEHAIITAGQRCLGREACAGEGWGEVREGGREEKSPPPQLCAGGRGKRQLKF